MDDEAFSNEVKRQNKYISKIDSEHKQLNFFSFFRKFWLS